MFCEKSMKNEYSSYNTSNGFGYTRRVIDGKFVGCSKCVGYCKYDGHPGFLTEKLRKEHCCCEKECHYYIQKPQRDRSEKKERKKILLSIMEEARKATADYEGMRVINVLNCDDNSCTLKYAAISNCYPIPSIEKVLSDTFGISVKLNKINCDFEEAAYLIFSNQIGG